MTKFILLHAYTSNQHYCIIICTYKWISTTHKYILFVQAFFYNVNISWTWQNFVHILFVQAFFYNVNISRYCKCISYYHSLRTVSGVRNYGYIAFWKKCFCMKQAEILENHFKFGVILFPITQLSKVFIRVKVCILKLKMIHVSS